MGLPDRVAKWSGIQIGLAEHLIGQSLESSIAVAYQSPTAKVPLLAIVGRDVLVISNGHKAIPGWGPSVGFVGEGDHSNLMGHKHHCDVYISHI